MEKWTAVGVFAVLAAVVGATVAYSVVHMPGSNRQPPGDPPVTVSDGSLHAHSKAKWAQDRTPANYPSGQTITPNSTAGALAATCPTVQVNSKNVAAYLWTDDEKAYDLTPSANTALTITIVHDPDDPDYPSTDSQVVISYPPNGPLTITTHEGSFDGYTLKNRLHSRRGNVVSINVTGTAAAFNPPNTNGAAATWTPPAGDFNPHFTLGFCYQ
jgi:hypothetical protein